MKYRTVIFYKDYFELFFERQRDKVKEKPQRKKLIKQ
jgi:hypothetical protein